MRHTTKNETTTKGTNNLLREALFGGLHEDLDQLGAAIATRNAETAALESAVDILARALCAMELSEAIGSQHIVIAYTCSLLPNGSRCVDRVKRGIQLAACVPSEEPWDDKRSHEEAARAVAFVRAAKEHAKAVQS